MFSVNILNSNCHAFKRACINNIKKNVKLKSKVNPMSSLHIRNSSASATRKSLILGIYNKEGTEDFQLTPNADKFNTKINGKLVDLIQRSGPVLKKGESREFYELDEEYACVSVACLGAPDLSYNELEEIEEKRENIRIALGSAAKKLQRSKVSLISVDECGDAEAAAEGVSLALFSFDELKNDKSRKTVPHLELFSEKASPVGWQSGLTKADGQKTAARLMEMPANHLTPIKFADIASQILEPKGVQVSIRDQRWIESKKMGSFLSVAQGSEQLPVFLELKFNGREKEAKPLVLVGKGITFDSGGISIKPSLNMDAMRGDMGGAACVVGAFQALADLKPPLNLVGLMPLCENMPSGRATKPGDVVTAMNGKTIQVDNTDAEGRLILADALCYAHEFNPMAIVDLATLTGAIDVALGSSAAGVFTNSRKMWMLIQQAGMGTGDRVWRMPLWSHFTDQVTKAHLADLNNLGKHKGQGGACTAAAFLREFVKSDQWVHIDIAGVMSNKDEVPYLNKGMTGRPTRTLAEFAQRLSQYGH